MRFTIPGEPIPAERPRVVRGWQSYIPKRTREYVDTVRYHAATQRPKQLTGPVYLEVDFYRSTKRRADCDNLLKCVMDAMLPHGGWKGVYRDDSQITTLIARKHTDKENPRTVVIVREDTLKLVEEP